MTHYQHKFFFLNNSRFYYMIQKNTEVHHNIQTGIAKLGNSGGKEKIQKYKNWAALWGGTSP